MYRIEDEVLLLSRGGRVSAGTHSRWRESARGLEERALREIALRESGVRVSLLARVRARLAGRSRAARGSGRRLAGAAGRGSSRHS